MTGVTSGPARANFDFKSATLPLVALLLKTTDAATLAAELARRLEESPDFFSDDPLVIDLSAVREQPDSPDFPALIALLRQHRVLPLAVRGGNPAQTAAAVGPSPAPGPCRKIRPMRSPSMKSALSEPPAWARGWARGTSAGLTRMEASPPSRVAWAISLMR